MIGFHPSKIVIMFDFPGYLFLINALNLLLFLRLRSLMYRHDIINHVDTFF